MTEGEKQGLGAADSALDHVVVDIDEDDNELSFREVQPVEVKVERLRVSIDTTSRPLGPLSSILRHGPPQDHQCRKPILKDISACMPCGTVTAIIGSSGSGKTSMLNALSHRIEGGALKTDGTVVYNGNPKLSSVRSAYVMQQDILIPSLTVRETLHYAAELRLPPPTTKKERERVVEDVILELGLKECADTRIGNSVHKGCSGGEKRRCSLAVQMLSNPSILFLDEVTTGLDAATAYQLVKTLKNLARKGRTAIVTIHQPRSEIWTLFDRVLLLAAGSPVYSGPNSQCSTYLETLGYEIPPFVNPAEFLIDLAAIDTRSPEAEASTSARVQSLAQAWEAHTQSREADRTEGQSSEAVNQRPAEQVNEEPSPIKIQHHAGLGRQVAVLTRRTLKVTWRDPMGIAGTILEAITMAVITGWVYYQLDGSQQGIRSREGALYTASALQGYLILLYETYRLTLDIQLFDREFGEGVTTVPAFLVSRRLARGLMEDIPIPLIFSLIFYFMAGFRPLAGQFFQFFAVILLTQFISVNLAVVCVAISRNFAVASLVANLNYTLQSLACGYFVQADQIPIWVRWLKWTAYTFYGFGALVANEFVAHTSNPAGHLYECPEPGATANPACKPYTGAFIMESLGLPSNWVSRPNWVLFGYVLAFFFLGGVILHFNRIKFGISRARKTDTDLSAGKEKMAESASERREIIIQLHEYALDVQKRGFPPNKTRTISILKPLKSEFPPGVLNVIMGPSGSGKSSLLNLMARRLHDSPSTTYVPSGNLTINGAVPSDAVMRSICSYVPQDDDALLPYLTVRENLQFAAGLRLPAHLTKAEKRHRADSVLIKMGLRDCADNLIGNDLVKGISGGEKRRVTIGIQILTDPRILFLDEPTSGLDAFTATSIIEVLRGLAQEGRTLVLTIHQSRSDLFQHFNKILLLARGGSPVYSGPGASMLTHFASLGFTCPSTTNPADFALDLITVNLQNEKRESRTREKVRSLIIEWNNNADSALTRAPSHIATPAELGSLARSMTPFRIAFPLLMHRSFINFRRNSTAIVARTSQVIGFGITVTLFFAPLKSDYYSVQSRLGFIQEFAPIYFVGMLQCVAVYPDERDVFYREHDDNAYSVEAFFLQYTLAELPFEIFTCIIFGTISVMAAGLHRTAALVFIVAFNAFAVVSCGESLGIMFTTLFAHTGFAVNIMSVFLSLAMQMAGVMSLNMPSALQAFNHLSPVKWSIGNLAPYTLRGVTFTCTAQQRLPDGSCPVTTGTDALKLYNLDTNAGLNLLALGICVVAYRMLAFLILKAARSRWALQNKLGWGRAKAGRRAQQPREGSNVGGVTGVMRAVAAPTTDDMAQTLAKESKI